VKKENDGKNPKKKGKKKVDQSEKDMYKQGKKLLHFDEIDVWSKILCCSRKRTKEKFEFLRFGT